MCRTHVWAREKPWTNSTNFNLRWPAPFMIHDLHPQFWGGRTVLESVRPPPQVAEEWEEDEEEAGSHLLQHVTTLQSSFHCLTGRQGEIIWYVCLCLGNVCAQISFQYVFMIGSLCWMCLYNCMCTVCACKSVHVSICCQACVPGTQGKHWVGSNCRYRLNEISSK